MTPTIDIHIRLTPKAAANKIGAVEVGADGTPILKVYVTAVPEDGKANTALINLLAKNWKLPKSALTLIRGATDRNKVIRVSGDLQQKARITRIFLDQMKKDD